MARARGERRRAGVVAHYAQPIQNGMSAEQRHCSCVNQLIARL